MVDARLHSAELLTLLKALPPTACNKIAGLMIGFNRRFEVKSRQLHLSRSVGVRGLTGHQLAPDIVGDVSILGAHRTGPEPTYRDILNGLALRHGINDDGQRLPASIERELQRQYLPALRPDPYAFTDHGSDAWWHRAAYAVPGWGWAAYALSPNWRIVTATVLEIAAQRRIALTHLFRMKLGD